MNIIVYVYFIRGCNRGKGFVISLTVEGEKGMRRSPRDQSGYYASAYTSNSVNNCVTYIKTKVASVEGNVRGLKVEIST